MAQEKLILYNYFRSSTSYRIRIALHLKNLDFAYKAVHLLKDGGEQNKAEYRDINPLGGVPALQCDSLIVSESVAILEFLDEKFPMTLQLYPGSADDRAIIRQMVEIVNSGLHPFSNLRVLQYLESHGYNPEQKQEWIENWMQNGLTALEAMAKKFSGQFLYKNSITAADICLVPHLFTARRFNIGLEKYSTLLKIEESLLKIEAVIKSHPYRQADTPEDLRIS
jgi:maleylacetoacetate isomerase